MRRSFVLGVVAVLFGVAAPAQAAFPGADGKIVYDHPTPPTYKWDVYVVNPDNTGVVALTNNPADDRVPDWSPDGTRIAFASIRDGNWEIYVMNADGTGQTRITNNAAADYSPDWSPDGTKIAFTRGGSILTMNADGTGEATLTTGYLPSWSPDGSRLAFNDVVVQHGWSISEVFVIDTDGTDRRQVTPSNNPNLTGDQGSSAQDWTPDGEKIAFVQHTWDSDDHSDIYQRIQLVRPDGSALQTVYGEFGEAQVGPIAVSPSGTRIAFDHIDSEVDTIAIDGSDLRHLSQTRFTWIGGIDWQPLPVNTPSTYARAKSATKIHAALVPAHAACTAPNRQHGGAFSHGSCDPPVHLSPTLTVGVGDGSLAFSRSVGSVVLKALTGTAGPPDDADMSIATSITNVMRKSDLSDYTGEIAVDLSLQLTDKEGAVAQTTMSFALSATVPCTATASTIDGATCALNTTLEALVPSAITEGNRSTFELGPVKVRDGGSDEDADTPAGEGTLATQGVFVP